jgi:hypothetical protein
MTDELTPEERDALRQLPRERMPSAALEERVVGAMRERGILATKPRGKVVRLTTGRVAGLLAASVVLVAGSYYIGHRGVGDDVIRRAEPQAPATTTMLQTDDAASAVERSVPASPKRTDEAPSTPADASRKLKAPESLSAPAPAAPAAPAELRQMAEAKKELEWSLKDADDAAGKADARSPETVQETAREEIAAQSTDELRARESTANQSPPPAAQSFSASPSPESAAGEQPERAYRLGSASLTVDAPESIEVTEDVENTSLVINSSGTLVRIRPATAGTSLQSGPKALYKSLGTVTRSYQLGTSRFEIDAPAGFRIVEDRKGGMLLIYTSDGIVRIRRAD